MRWVIEARNGHLENFKALGNVPNNTLSHIMTDYKIAASIINCFYQKLESDRENAVQIAADMKLKISTTNTCHLEKYLVEFKKTTFTRIDANDIDNFPKIDIELIKNKITFGTYQLKNSYGYLAEHLKKNGRYEIFVNKNNLKNSNVVLSKIQSRHINRTEYHVVIEYIPYKNDENGILGWTCTCKIGKRDVGNCSHVACIIFYLAYGKYQDKLPQPGFSLNNLLINVGINDLDESDSDEFVENCELSKDSNEEDTTYSHSTHSNKISRELSSSSIQNSGKKTKLTDNLTGNDNSEETIVNKLFKILPNGVVG